MGGITGIICFMLASSGGKVLPLPIVYSIIFSRALLGFGIGISKLRLKWWLHGMILGIVFSIPMAISTLSTPDSQRISIFIGTIIMGAIYGLIIELVATVIFKATKV